MWHQTQVRLKPRKRGFHLITDEILQAVPEIHQLKVGLCHVFIQHTSASLSLNENADPTVRMDMEEHFNRYVPERAPYYQHDYEGDDDMPAHIKNVLIGSSVSLPIHRGGFRVGTWQGIYLCEHRDHGGSRSVIITLNGE
ncbi:secondary thiamine-phosphate synthase enzyme YjbQ [Pokkaliibacter sp. CJK22405]|uniref:secondary thiamine-phosphate synthase enzyme YjbQ n=1 Tax=Pokkaliibacter sp. CJK22405 TaxID=3384615 RepID=UPI003985285D